MTAATAELDVAVQAERAVLGALLADSGRAWPEVAPLLEADDFSHGHHATIFGAIRDACISRSAADPITVSEALGRDGVLEAAGGIGYLARLARNVLSVDNAAAHAALVRQEALRNRARLALLKSADELGENARPPSEVLGELQRNVTDWIERSVARSDCGMLEAARLAVDDFDRRVTLGESGQLAGVETGLKRLDRMTGGLEPGLIVLAALTSLGKTALAWHIALATAARGVACAIVSLEMTAVELARRAFARVHGIPLGELMRGDAKAFSDLCVADADHPVANLPIRIDDSASTLDQVVARITTWHSRHGIKLAIVDYLQLVTAGNEETRQLEVARVSRELKRLALRLRIPIVAISQFSRAAAAASSAGDKPELHHLRDSGAVEQDADVVLMLWRTSQQRDADMQDRPRQCCVSVLKSRNGIVGDVYSAKGASGPLIFEASTQRFREWAGADGTIDGGETATDLPRSRNAYALGQRRHS